MSISSIILLVVAYLFAVCLLSVIANEVKQVNKQLKDIWRTQKHRNLSTDETDRKTNN